MTRAKRVGFFSNSGRVGFGYWKKLWVRVQSGSRNWQPISDQSGIIRILTNRVLSIDCREERCIGSIERNTVPRAIFPKTLPRECAESADHSFDIIPVASEYQEIHPNSALNIDSVYIKKI